MKQVVELEDGYSDWIYPTMERYRMGCCDCGLVHDIQFKVKRDKRGLFVAMRAKRNNRSTSLLRRGMKNARI